MGLIDGLRPKWKNSDPDVRLAAAKELTDINVLKEIVCTDRDWMVRHHVFMALKDLNASEAVFIELAKTASDEEIRRKAIKKIKDEAALEDIDWLLDHKPADVDLDKVEELKRLLDR